MNATYLKQWCLFLAAFVLSFTAFAREAATAPGLRSIPVAQLPAEARRAMALIKQGGPFPYPKDGVVFGNYEGLLPKQPRGYYHEFTVKTPGTRSRGAQRLVVGGRENPATEFYYTPDHYATFMRVQE